MDADAEASASDEPRQACKDAYRVSPVRGLHNVWIAHVILTAITLMGQLPAMNFIASVMAKVPVKATLRSVRSLSRRKTMVTVMLSSKAQFVPQLLGVGSGLMRHLDNTQPFA